MVSVRVVNPHSGQKAGLLFGESAPILHRPGEEERGWGAGAISMLPDHAWAFARGDKAAIQTTVCTDFARTGSSRASSPLWWVPRVWLFLCL